MGSDHGVDGVMELVVTMGWFVTMEVSGDHGVSGNNGVMWLPLSEW